MDPTKPIPDVVLFFKSTFSIILALALAEAFKQFVSDKADDPKEPVVYLHRVPALLSFLFLIIPFYQGMSRYFFVTYADVRNLPQPYSIFLMIDGAALMAESALFFIMSRALSYLRWRSFYTAVLALLALDSIWDLIGLLHGAPIFWWITLNIVFGTIVAWLLHKFKEPPTNNHLPVWSAILMLVRTILDYGLMWHVYFP